MMFLSLIIKASSKKIMKISCRKIPILRETKTAEIFRSRKKGMVFKKISSLNRPTHARGSVTRFSTFVLFISSIYSTEQYELSFKFENFDSTVKSECYA